MLGVVDGIQMRDATIIAFIEKVEILEHYKFVNTVLTEQTGWLGSFDDSGEVEEILIGPNREEVDAAIVIVRQLIQNNDAISINNIVNQSRAYLTPEAVRTLDEIRYSLNNDLDLYPPIGLVGNAKNYRVILDIFIYGEHAHTNMSKRKVYKEIQDTKVPNLLTHYFYVALRTIIAHSIHIKMLLSTESSYRSA